MREVKFRAWDGCAMRSVSGINFYDEYLRLDETPQGDGLTKKISESILMQFTGLKDKNGKEIYKGDILLHFERFKRLCEYQDGAFGYKSDLDFGFISYNSNAYNLGLAESVITKAEVIGNIYQNPELLKD